MNDKQKTNLERLLEAEQRIATLEHSLGVALAMANKHHAYLESIVPMMNKLMQESVDKKRPRISSKPLSEPHTIHPY